ncbi:MAG: tetratricopeptide repeat protein [Asticcacaulis sp.]
MSDKVADRRTNKADVFRPLVMSLVIGVLVADPVLAATKSRPPSAYGLYLAGRQALAEGEVRQGADMLSRAAGLDPTSADLKTQAFLSALFTGDLGTAARLAPVSQDAPRAIVWAGALANAVKAMDDQKGRDALAALDRANAIMPGEDVVLYLRPWALAQKGDWKAALTPVVSDDPQGLSALILEHGRALRLEMRGRQAEAETVYKTLMASRAKTLFALSYGEFLERRGRADEARAVFTELLDGVPEDSQVKAALHRLEQKAAAPAAPSLKSGAAMALNYGSALLQAQRQSEMSLAVNRMALALDPAFDRSWIMVAQSLERMEQTQAATEAYGQIGPDSPFYVEAQVRLIWLDQTAQRPEAALSRSRSLVQAQPASLQAVLALSELLRTQKQTAASVKVIEDWRNQYGETALTWRALFSYGISLEADGRWTEAESALQKALQLSPEQPEILNFLGYSWIDRGVKIEEGMGLVRKALAARSDSGAMLDSLAWGHYRLGQYQLALELTEQAVQLEPGDPEINAHLGDIYLAVGRSREAVFQWRRALSLEPADKLKAELEQKLSRHAPVKSGPGTQVPVIAGASGSKTMPAPKVPGPSVP